MRLVLVDDQAEFLSLARARLTRSPGLEIVGEASSGEAALALWPELRPEPEAVLLDVEMPGLDGFETARRLRQIAPTLRIILTSGAEERGYPALASSVGGVFLSKRSLSAEAVLRLLEQ